MNFIQFLVANYNSIDHIHILIKSLRQFHPGVRYQILVADQGSVDGSKQYLKSLPEVRLWEISDRKVDSTYNEKQEYLIEKHGLEPYIHPFFRKRTVEIDSRTFHGSAINFLVGKVDAPLFATLDTDVEFLGGLWVQPFLEAILGGCQAVGTLEEPISFTIGGFTGFTCWRHHPCLTVYVTQKVANLVFDFNTDDCFELRMPMIHRCLVENVKECWQLGDMGYKIYKQLDKKTNLPDHIYYRSIRHFYGATVKKDKQNPLLLDWLKSVEKEKKLYEYGRDTYHYTSLNEEYLKFCSSYWSEKNPELVIQPETKIVYA